MKFLIRADGNKEIGMGHIKRQADLASALSRKGHLVDFLFRKNPKVEKFLEEMDVSAKCNKIPAEQENEREFLDKTFEKNRFDVSLVDVLGPEAEESYLEIFRQVSQELVVFTDTPDYCPINADVVFNPSLEQLEYDYSDLETEYYLGPDYFISDPEFSQARRSYKLSSSIENIMIMIGGGDTTDTPKTLLKLLSGIEYWQEADIVLSPTYEKKGNLERFANSLGRDVNVHQYIASVADLMEASDVLICSAGNTAYEACIVGVPLVTVNQVEWQNSHAELLEERGLALNLGYAEDVQNSQLSNSMKYLDKFENRKAMHVTQKEIFEGRGLKNTLRVLLP